MRLNEVKFSIASFSAWAPGIETPEAWSTWAEAPFPIVARDEPPVKKMAPMLRRRAGLLGKMALEVAYQSMGERSDIPTIFCSRHGEVSRAVDLLGELAQGIPLSPTGFGLAVHNASAGLFSIARTDHANHLALAAGASTIENGVIEACGLLADGAPAVLLVAYEDRLPAVFSSFADCDEQAYAWACLMVPAQGETIHLSWSAARDEKEGIKTSMPPGLEILQFHLRGDALLERIAGQQRWCWTRHA